MKHINRGLLAFSVALLGLLGFATAAGATTTPPPTPGQQLVTDMESQATSFMTNDGAPMVVALFVLAAIFGIALRWATKGKQAAGKT